MWTNCTYNEEGVGRLRLLDTKANEELPVASIAYWRDF